MTGTIDYKYIYLTGAAALARDVPQATIRRGDYLATWCQEFVLVWISLRGRCPIASGHPAIDQMTLKLIHLTKPLKIRGGLTNHVHKIRPVHSNSVSLEHIY